MKTLQTNIFRFNPLVDSEPYQQAYGEIEYQAADNVLDLILKINETIDSTLTFRYSCESTICGCCAMHINGKARLACDVKVAELAEEGCLTIEPLNNFAVIKDLVVDIDPMLADISSVTPWLVTSQKEPLPDQEFVIEPELLNETLKLLDQCILCGICHADSGDLEPNTATLSPVALVKSLKLINDPRDTQAVSRLNHLVDLGLFNHPDKSAALCPKGINLTADVIEPLKKTALEAELK